MSRCVGCAVYEVPSASGLRRWNISPWRSVHVGRQIVQSLISYGDHPRLGGWEATLWLRGIEGGHDAGIALQRDRNEARQEDSRGAAETKVYDVGLVIDCKLQRARDSQALTQGWGRGDSVT